jgi:hypothetical protein
MDGKGEMMATYKVLAVNDERDFCECCGRQNLKKVAWIENEETGEIKHFGTTCATAPQKGFNVDREIKRAMAEFEYQQQLINQAAHREYRKQGGKYAPPDAKGIFKMRDRALFDSIRAQIVAA